jgi:hypothetical protein
VKETFLPRTFLFYTYITKILQVVLYVLYVYTHIQQPHYYFGELPTITSSSLNTAVS